MKAREVLTIGKGVPMEEMETEWKKREREKALTREKLRERKLNKSQKGKDNNQQDTENANKRGRQRQ